MQLLVSLLLLLLPLLLLLLLLSLTSLICLGGVLTSANYSLTGDMIDHGHLQMYNNYILINTSTPNVINVT